MKSKHFTVAHTYTRVLKSEHCSSAATFVSKVLLQDKLNSFANRVKLRLKELKGK